MPSSCFSSRSSSVSSSLVPRRSLAVVGLILFGLLGSGAARSSSDPAWTAASPEALPSRPPSPQTSPQQTSSRVVETGEPSCYVGVLAPRGEADVPADAGGILVELVVGIGDRVRKGQEIARVDSRDSAHRLKEQTARLDAARSSLRSSEVETRRSRQEMQRRHGAPDLFSTEQIEAAQFELELAEIEHQRRLATLAEAEAALARLEHEESRSRILAPFDGKVSALYALAGTTVSLAQPVLHLVSSSRPTVRFAVPAADVEHFPIGSSIHAEAVGSPSSIAATVETIAPVLDEASQLIFVEAGTHGDAWDGVPVGAPPIGALPIGAALRVGSAGTESCLNRPVAVLPTR